MRHALMGAALAAILCACATPTTIRPQVNSAAEADEAEKQANLVVQTRLEEAQRLDRVVGKLFTANADLCPFKKPRVLINVATVYDFPAEMRPAFSRMLGLNETARIFTVVPGGPAALAGLQEGDEMLQINGVDIPTGAKARGRFGAELSNALERDPTAVKLRVRRGAELKDITVKPQLACGYNVELVESSDINAYADGKSIFVTRGIMRLATTDEELALVISHELAHDAQQHMSAQRRNSAIAGIGGAALDVLAAAGGVNTGGAFTKAAMNAGQGFASAEFEAEADYVGMYYMARAGYPTAGVETFWRKMAVEQPASIFIKRSHPTNPQRFIALHSTNDEIEAKRSSGAVLTPNTKK